MSKHDGEYLDIDGKWYPENPKMVGSGVVACRPQVGDCEGRCADCYFRGGRYYEDLNRPHIPDPKWVNDNGLIVRMNDGNDSNYQWPLVCSTAHEYNDVFFNTRLPLLKFPAPVVLTVNGDHSDEAAWMVSPDEMKMLMCVRARANTWNSELVEQVIDYYCEYNIPVRLTYMAYYHTEPRNKDNYEWRTRTLNPYWCITAKARERLEEALWVDGFWVHACTSRKGHLCRECGKCLEIYRWWKKEKQE